MVVRSPIVAVRMTIAMVADRDPFAGQGALEQQTLNFAAETFMPIMNIVIETSSASAISMIDAVPGPGPSSDVR